MSVYNTEPVKNNKGDKPANSPTITNGSNPVVETKTVSYSVTSDFYYQNRGTLIDPDTGKRLTAGDFYKKILSGAAGLVYNTLLLITVQGKVAQITLNAGRVTASTVSLAADDVKVLNAFMLSLTTLAGKPSFATYDATKPFYNSAKEKLLAQANPVSQIAGQAIGVWQGYGKTFHNAFHSGPALHLGKPHLNKAGEAHYPFTVALGGLLATVEAGVSKTVVAKNIIPYKKEYAGWTKGTDGVNQTFLENVKYSSTDPENSLTLNIRRDFEFNNRKKEGLVFGAAAFGVVEKQKIDNTRLVPMMLGDSRTTEQKLESFISRFEDKKSKNIWIERLDRIFQPEMYANYDKAKKELKALTKHKKGGEKISAALQFFVDATIGDIAKSLQKIGKGYSGASKLDAGIDYNSTFINQLAAYKTDLEAAGGAFIIQSNGTFSIKTPPPPLTITPTPGTVLTTNTNAGVSGNSGTAQVVMGDVTARLSAIKGNEPAIWKLVKDSNNAAATEAYVNFKNENKELVKGKWNAEILPLFYTAYPQYAPKEFNRQRALRSGDAARAKIYSRPSYKDF